MAASSAQIAANRRNASKSTGPRTAQGKARARANAVKHGLTGAGVALPNEDASRVKQRFLGLQAAMAPANDLGMVLVHKVALMSVRVERAARQETVALSYKMRHAAEEFELARLAEVDRLFESIETDPSGIRRRLLTSVEGVDKLVAALGGFKDQLRAGLFAYWDEKTREKVEAFFGGTGTTFPISRTNALLETMAGNPRWLKPGELDHLPPGKNARRDWARDELSLLVDAEVARLAQARAAIDPRTVTLDRLEAADRAMFDPGPEAMLARKYEAAATRGFFRALRDFREAETSFEESSEDALTLLRGDVAATSEEEKESRRYDVPLEYPPLACNRFLDETLEADPNESIDEHELPTATEVIHSSIKQVAARRGEAKSVPRICSNEANPVIAVSAGRSVESTAPPSDRPISPENARENVNRAPAPSEPVRVSSILNYRF